MKTNMKNLIYSFLALVLIGCNQEFLFSECESFNTTDNQEKIENTIIKKVATQLKKEKNLQPIGFGGQTSNGVEMLALSFNYSEKITIKETRELLIIAVDAFVDAVNSEERIHCFLNNYPFEPKNVEIAIYLYNKDGSDVTGGELTIATSYNSIFRYKMNDPKTDRFKIIHQESYQDALLRPEIDEKALFRLALK